MKMRGWTMLSVLVMFAGAGCSSGSSETLGEGTQQGAPASAGSTAGKGGSGQEPVGGSSAGGQVGGGAGGGASGKETSADQCENGLDDDGDGKVDCADPDCKVAFFETLCKGATGAGGAPNGGVGGATSTSEESPDECQDGVDNDGDGNTDCDDTTCLAAYGSSLCSMIPTDDDAALQGGYAPSPEEAPVGSGAGACVGSPTTLLLAVPWLPQVPPGSWDFTMNCGVASYAMVDGYLQSTTPTAATITSIDDWMNEKVSGWSKNGYNGNAKGTTTGQIVAVATGYGTYASSSKFTGLDCAGLRDELGAGRPVIVTVDTQSGNNFPGTTMKPSKHGHFMVLVGMDNQYVYVHDPGRSAAKNGCGEGCKGRRFTLDSFDAVWAKHGRSGVFIRAANGSGQTCGNGICEPGNDEDCNSCDTDCGCDACSSCSSGGACVKAPPSCGSKVCGVDACGSSCGTCAAGTSCDTALGQCIASCPAGCSGHGDCNAQTGKCSCAPGFTGSDCAQCAPGYVGYPSCAPDACAGNDCSGHGACAGGVCSCDTGYQGPSCGSCANGYKGYPSCVIDACSGTTCDTPPNNQCYASSGACSNGVCSYTPMPFGTPCNDGDPCTTADACDGSGACTGAQNQCSGNGFCSGGVCNCSGGYSGPDCSIPPCSPSCGGKCGGSDGCGGTCFASCSNGQSCQSNDYCGCSSSNNGQFTILNPNGGTGCTSAGGPSLAVTAQMVTATMVRFFVTKSDGTAFGSGGTLSVYVGTGPTCPNPPNIIKTTTSIVVGQSTQTIDLTLNPYNGGWNVNDTKQFWIGKDESGFQSVRATAAVSIQRTCAP